MQFHSLPKFFNKDHSPMSATDSPFPPLKTEHRYRGVYERAGFDVNLGGSPTDSGSSRNSPHSQRFQRSSAPSRNIDKASSRPMYASQSRNVSSGPMPRGAHSKPNTPSIEHYDSRRNFSDSKLSHRPANEPPSAGAPAGFDPYAHFKSQNSNASSRSSQSSQPKYTASSSAPYAKRYEAEPVVPRAVKENDADRNKKNLKLHIPEGKSQYINSQETGSTSVTSSPFDTDRERSSPSTSLGSQSETQASQKRDVFAAGAVNTEPAASQPPPARESPPYPTFDTEKDLNQAFAGAKQDVSDPGLYDPRGFSEKTTGQATKSPVEKFVPSTSNLVSSFNRQNEWGDDSSSQDGEQTQFESTRQSLETPESSASEPSNDYDDFLHQNSGTRSPQYNRHLSTISSIISKPFNDESDEEDEVELDLKRQLENIKEGSTISLQSTNMFNSEDSFVTASNVSAGSRDKAQMPIFKVSPAEENESEGSDTETEFEKGEAASSSPELSEEDNVDAPMVEPETPQFEKTRFDDTYAYETPETIKPLSPKNHQVERELENLNFCNTPQVIVQEAQWNSSSGDHQDETVHKNLTSAESENLNLRNEPQIIVHEAQWNSSSGEHQDETVRRNPTSAEFEDLKLRNEPQIIVHEAQWSSSSGEHQDETVRRNPTSAEFEDLKLRNEPQIIVHEAQWSSSNGGHQDETVRKNPTSAESENFYFRNEPQVITQEAQWNSSNGEQEDDILRKNPTPREFEAFPKSVIDPKVPKFRTSEVQKNKAGTGPCRTCGQAVVSHSGPKKAIFSKTGELSGQWHRECFVCSYGGCGIQFNKNVTSYVLLDNPFCHHHYHTLNDTLCQACHLGIEGECIENELKQKWHLQCLACTRCMRQIGSDYFLIDGNIVCEEDSQAVIADLERSGMLTSDKVEKRRTRMLFID